MSDIFPLPERILTPERTLCLAGATSLTILAVLGAVMTVLGRTWYMLLPLAFVIALDAEVISKLNPRITHLRLDERGLTRRTLWRTIFVPWGMIEYAVPTGSLMSEAVGLTFWPEIRRRKPFNQGDIEVMLADTYGMSGHQLAELLIEYRNAAYAAGTAQRVTQRPATLAVKDRP